MRIKLLTNGGFRFLEHVSFPVEVEAYSVCKVSGLASVYREELERIGATENVNLRPWWSFLPGYEVIE